jgi:probable F420-dependent oxidoreductase
MNIGVFMFATDYAIRIDQLARECEARGFESLFVPEHTHIPTSRKTPWPGGAPLPEEYWHTFDPFVSLMAAAAATRKLKIGTGICLVIERDTIVMAKEVASLDTLSDGRFLFGIGAGWNREEMEHHGTDYKTRFSKMREQVLAMKEIWTRDEAEFHGKHVAFDPIWSWPKPAQKPHPPILLGGATPKTRERVVEFCDGWLPIGTDQKAVLDGIADLERLAEAKGRPRSTISVSVFGARPERETLEAYERGGVERVLLRLPSAPRDQILPLLDRYTELVVTA